MNRSATRLYGFALLAGLPPALLLASSCVAFHYAFDPVLGRPLWWHLYSPFAVVRWAMAWGLDEAHRAEFLRALSLDVIVWLLPAAAVRLYEMGGPMAPDERVPGALLATPRDLVAAGGFGCRWPGVAVGMHGREPLFRTAMLHTLLLGPTGAGKGVSTIIPTLLTWPHSAVVKDPKRELNQITGQLRSHLGPVFRIDPTDPRSARFNPLLAIRTGESIVTDAMTLAHILAEADDAQRDAIWSKAATLVVTALLVATRLSGEPTLATFYASMRGLMAGRIPRTADADMQSVLEEVWTAWPEKTRGSVFFNLRTRLAFLASPLVQAVFSGDDFRADDLAAGPRPVTVYICTPLNDADAMRPLHRLLLVSLMRPLTAELDHVSDGRPKVRDTLVAWDEFPSDGHIAPFETILANARGYRVWLLLGAQDQEQIERIYGEHNSIAVNCRLRIYSASLSEKSLRREQALVGSGPIVRRGRSRGSFFLSRCSRSESEASAPLVENGELMALAEDHALVFAPGLPRPAKVAKLRYYRHPAFRGLFDDKGGPSYGLAPAPRPLGAGPAPAALTLSLTAEQVDALGKRSKPGETPEAFLARFLSKAGGKPSAPPPPPSP